MAIVACKPWPPRIPASTGFGINGHLTWNNSICTNGDSYASANDAATIAYLLDLGMTTYRNGYSVSQTTSGVVTTDPSARFKQFIALAAPAGIVTAPVLLPNNTAASAGVVDEATGYTAGFALGANVATKLKGLVPYYEIGNEMEAVPGNKVIQTGTGRSDSHYDAAKFKIFRGIFFGMVDGVLSVDTTTPMIYFNSTYQHTGFADMIINGRAPDSGGLVIPGQRKHVFRPGDGIGHHWYANNNASADDPTSSQGFNVLAFLAGYGVPIYITECGAVWVAYGRSETATTAALLSSSLVIDKLIATRKTYGIKQINFYQLYDSASGLGADSTGDEMNFGACSNPSTTKGRYANIKATVAANRY